MASETLEVIITAKDQTGGALNGLKSTLGGIGAIAGGVLTAGVGLAATAFGALVTEIGASVQAASDSEVVITQLNAVLESTGGIAGVTSQAAQDLSTSLQAVTRFSDETILSGENMLLTFTNIGKDIFPAATETMLDMSQALGQDVKASAIQLGKALQDPIEGVTALRRVGVNFTDAQKDMIKSLVEAGKVEEAQKLILKELQTEFGGSAEAAGKTFAGQMDILRNKFDDVQEKIGAAFIPVLLHLAETLMPYVDKYLPMFADFMVNVVAPALDTVVTALGQLLSHLENGTGPVADINLALQQLGLFLQPITDGLAALGLAFQSTTPAFTQAGADIQATMTQLFSTLGPQVQQGMTELVALIGGALKGIAQFWHDHGAEITAVVGFIIRLVVTNITNWLLVLTGIIRTGMAILRGDWAGAWDIIKETVTNIMNNLLALFGTSLPKIAASFASLGSQIRTYIQSALTFIQNLIPQFVQFGRGIIQGIITGIQNDASNLIETITRIINDTIKAVMDTLDMSSPSKVFANIGMNMTAGMGEGMMQAAPSVYDAGRMVAGSATAGAQDQSTNYNWHSYGPQTYVFPGISDPQEMLRKLGQMG